MRPDLEDSDGNDDPYDGDYDSMNTTMIYVVHTDAEPTVRSYGSMRQVRGDIAFRRRHGATPIHIALYKRGGSHRLKRLKSIILN